MNWQPIETAPVGMEALFWIKWSRTPVVGEWDGRRFRASSEHHAVSCGTYCYGGSVCTETGTDPTHWCAIEPPKETP